MIHDCTNTEGIIILNFPDFYHQKKNTLYVFDILENMICNDPIYSQSVVTNVYKCLIISPLIKCWQRDQENSLFCLNQIGEIHHGPSEVYSTVSLKGKKGQSYSVFPAES